MKSTKPFGYAVTKAGLPRDWCTIEAFGDENISQLTAQDIAKTYWLLESIHIDFAYTINGIRRERNVLLESNVQPVKRIEQNPTFYYNTSDSDEVNCLIELELHSIAHYPKNECLYSLNLHIKEHDEEHLFTLSTQNMHDQHLLDSRNFEFMNRELTIKLWTVSTKWQGNIEYFSAKPGYYMVNNSIL